MKNELHEIWKDIKVIVFGISGILLAIGIIGSLLYALYYVVFYYEPNTPNTKSDYTSRYVNDYDYKFSITEVYPIGGVDNAKIAILYDEEYDQEYIIIERTDGKFTVVPRIYKDESTY